MSYCVEWGPARLWGKCSAGLAWDREDDNSYADLYLLDALIPAGRDWKELVPDVTTHLLAAAGYHGQGTPLLA